jgi:hypothetical protein
MTEPTPPPAERVWFARLDRALTHRDDAGRRVDDRYHEEPLRTLFRRLLEVQTNCPQLMHIPEDGQCSYEPNPWHADPPDPGLIEAGTGELLDRIGAAAGIGPRPTR